MIKQIPVQENVLSCIEGNVEMVEFHSFPEKMDPPEAQKSHYSLQMRSNEVKDMQSL